MRTQGKLKLFNYLPSKSDITKKISSSFFGDTLKRYKKIGIKPLLITAL